MFFLAIIKFKAVFVLCLPKFRMSNKNFESMLSNLKTKLNVKSTPNLISVDYFKLIYNSL